MYKGRTFLDECSCYLTTLSKSESAEDQYLHKLFSKMKNHFNDYFDSQAKIFKVEKLFDEAIKDTEISAWVCANDVVAERALDYLKRKRVRIPNDLSVVSYDDSSIAYSKRITSYNFNSTGLVKAMIHFCLNPRRALRITPNRRLLTMPGFLVERESSGLCI